MPLARQKRVWGSHDSVAIGRGWSRFGVPVGRDWSQSVAIRSRLVAVGRDLACRLVAIGRNRSRFGRNWSCRFGRNRSRKRDFILAIRSQSVAIRSQLVVSSRSQSVAIWRAGWSRLVAVGRDLACRSCRFDTLPTPCRSLRRHRRQDTKKAECLNRFRYSAAWRRYASRVSMLRLIPHTNTCASARSVL